MGTHKVAIITGASRGIGAGLVAGYRGHDWAVVATARTIRPSADPDLLTVAADLTQPATADRIVDATLDRFGRIDTLVNSAVVCLPKMFTDYTAADYTTAVGVNLTGFFWLTQRAAGEMAIRFGGHLVNVIPVVTEIAGSGTPPALAALTRGGVVAATRSLADEYASRGIRVNAVSPSGQAGGGGQISDVVAGILFLESSPFITGEILHIDGARSAGSDGGLGWWHNRP
jgi:NAD(P)-dependent dehydrogenase (short-subunit alcohol dehydrogenase family)